ncbi:hypothetical protein EWM64_g7500 [Hericium alpestre]|uniref:Fungal STAND N-terminal Goodbye domain-containing protein n=1 Tax=Hericium alpestre TaxID=135208 RepID=A0A4Y9ZR54_9AGAM|nr:hypothetical protein EWM64_g7500 [Hericium alpestre]
MTDKPRKQRGRVRLFIHNVFHRSRDPNRAHPPTIRSLPEPPSPIRVRPVDIQVPIQKDRDINAPSDSGQTIYQTRHTPDLQFVHAEVVDAGVHDVTLTAGEDSSAIESPPDVPRQDSSLRTTDGASPLGDMSLLHSPDDLLLVTAQGPSSPGRASSAALTAWTVFKEALKVTETFSDAFPPLKAAVSGLNAVFDRIKMVNDARGDFVEARDRINRFTEVIQRYRDSEADNIPSEIRKRVKGFAQALDLQKFSIEDKLERGIIKRTIEASDDQAELARHVRTIGHLVDQFTMATTLNTDANVEELLKDVKFSKLKYFAEAAFNGPHSFGKGCMADTRVSVLGNLMSWAVDSGPGASHVYWLTGLAGTGKSAIAYSFCRLLNDAGLLGGSFFCSRQAEFLIVQSSLWMSNLKI